jgi:hypothetical protein
MDTVTSPGRADAKIAVFVASDKAVETHPAAEDIGAYSW